MVSKEKTIVSYHCDYSDSMNHKPADGMQAAYWRDSCSSENALVFNISWTEVVTWCPLHRCGDVENAHKSVSSNVHISPVWMYYKVVSFDLTNGRGETSGGLR